MSTSPDRAVLVHLVRMIQDSPDVRWYVGGHGSRMRELLIEAIRASGFEGDPADALAPPSHRENDEPHHKRLQREIDALDHMLDEACEIAEALAGYIAIDNPYARIRERCDRITALKARSP